MDFEELIVLLACHSLEDFPDHLQGKEADSLLGAWSALWHPQLLASAGRIPTWYRADCPPESLAGRLVIVPPPSESHLPPDWNPSAAEGPSAILRGLTSRDEMIAAALAVLGKSTPPTALELAPDFLALGLCHLLVELLTRYMRYTSNVDENRLDEHSVSAARAAVGGDRDEARHQLKLAFEVLLEAREKYYPVEAYLVDVTLLADTTLGNRLSDALAGTEKTNFLASGELIERLSREHPTTLAALREALESGRAAVIGGEFREGELPLWPLESMLENLRRGMAAYQQHLGRRVVVFARRRSGLSPLLPQILSRLVFEGVLHVAFGEGRVPASSHSKVRWEGLDHSAIDALMQSPLDASRGESVLRLPRRMGESMDHDHVATVLFAHWPGDVSPFYRDLCRAAAYAPVLGSFTTLPDYFLRTDRPGDLVQFPADDYRSPDLAQSVTAGQSDPISRHLRRHRRRAWTDAAQTLSTLAILASRTSGGADGPAAIPEFQPDETDDKILTEELQNSARRFAAAVCGNSAGQATLLANPRSFSRRVAMDVKAGTAPLAADLIAGPPGRSAVRGTHSLVDLPPMGFIRDIMVEPGKKARPLAEGNVLRNEFFEVTVNAQTGAIRSIHDYKHRGNRLSQQLAVRLPQRSFGALGSYSTMVADRVEVTCSGPVIGEITARGRLIDDQGLKLAEFVQTLRLWRGSRVMLLDIELDMDDMPDGNPWQAYCAARFAWGDPTSEIYRNLGLANVKTASRKIEAPLLIDVRADDCRISILTGGLPYHLRSGDRMLDSLLVVRGETARQFRLGIGVDLDQPLQEALSLLDPVVAVVGQSQAPPNQRSGWLFRLDAKNVIGTAWQPLNEGPLTVGFRARLCETKGRPGRVRLTSFRPVRAAQQVDFLGQTLAVLPVEGDRITIDFGSYEWVEVEARFADDPRGKPST